MRGAARWAAVVALGCVCAGVAVARVGRFERINSRTPEGRNTRGFPGAESPPFFEFAPASGAGLVSAGNLCDQLQDSERVGNWWCLNGDGTMASGSQKTLSANGTPTTVSNATCPNGPDCAARTGQRLDSSDYY